LVKLFKSHHWEAQTLVQDDINGKNSRLANRKRQRERDISMTYNFDQLFTKLILNYTIFILILCYCSHNNSGICYHW